LLNLIRKEIARNGDIALDLGEREEIAGLWDGPGRELVAELQHHHRHSQ
jgi:hypothetical protein